MPKAADNDIPALISALVSTAREIATQAIDRLHTTANATHRIMIVELRQLLRLAYAWRWPRFGR